MIFIQKIEFIEPIEFEVTRQSHNSRKTRVELSKNRFDRKIKTIWFEVIPQNFSIDFSHITVIVGDNGYGKTTLLKQFKLPDFDHCENNEQVQKLFGEYLKNDKRILSLKSTPAGVMMLNELHKSAIQKEMNNKNSADMYFGREGAISDCVNLMMAANDSNGEAVIDILFGLNIENSVIVLDEPETSLSLKSIGKLKKLILEWSKNNQIIISTHHPYLMKIVPQVFDIETGAFIDTNEYLDNF
jgi:predicted ATPase